MNNNEIKTKPSIFKILLIVIDIIVLIGFIIIVILWFRDKKNENNNQNNQIDNSIVSSNFKYKKFTFKMPDNIKYNVIDDKRFELSSDNYRAVVEIFIDENNYMLLKSDAYYKALIDYGYNVDKPYETKINNIPVLIYNKHDENNSLYCHFQTREPFSIEIELFNKDNTFKIDYLESIMTILLDNEYDYDSEEKFAYYSTENDPKFNNKD